MRNLQPTLQTNKKTYVTGNVAFVAHGGNMHPSHLDGTMEGTVSANTMSGQHALLRLLFQRALDALLEHFLQDVLVTIVSHHVLVALYPVPSSYLDAIVCF
jgi:hypothetical protein